MSGRVFFAEHNGTSWVKLTGDLRADMCPTLNHCFEKVTGKKTGELVVDLSELRTGDSTVLGTLARLGMDIGKRSGNIPRLIAPRRDISRLLYHMKFDLIFIISDAPEFSGEGPEVREVKRVAPENEEVLSGQVESAHRALVKLGGVKRSLFANVFKLLRRRKTQRKT